MTSRTFGRNVHRTNNIKGNDEGIQEGQKSPLSVPVLVLSTPSLNDLSIRVHAMAHKPTPDEILTDIEVGDQKALDMTNERTPTSSCFERKG